MSQQYCVRWNSHLGSLGSAFLQLLAGQRFVDVTLACEGHQVHCHRLVLAACSTYFESLLGENPCKHTIIILPRDIKLWEIQALVDFMYKGEVNVSQAGLPDLFRCAETLQIRGLCGSDAALNLNHITNSTTTSSSTSTTTTNNTSLHHITATNATANTISITPVTTSASSIATNSTSTPYISRPASRSKVVIGPAISSPSGATGLDVTSSTSQITNILRTALTNAATIKLSAPSTTSNASSVSLASTSISLDDGDDSANGSGSEVEADLKMRVDCSDDLDGSGKLQSETVDEQQPPKNRHTPPDHQLTANRRQSSLHHQQYNKSLIPSSSPVIVGDRNVIGSDIVTKNSVTIKSLTNTTTIPLPPPLDDYSCCLIDDDDEDDDAIAGSNISEENFENIICSPNLIGIPYMNDEYDFDDDQDNHDSSYACDDAEMSNMTMSNGDEPMPRPIPFGLLQTQIKDESTGYHEPMPKNLFALRAYRRSMGNMSLTHNNGKPFNRKITLLNNGGCSPSPSAVVLRNPPDNRPRAYTTDALHVALGKRPRTYTTDALYAALMDVKDGESVSRASLIYNVPQKTLRGWMKRWHIKFAIEITRQRKQAAKKL